MKKSELSVITKSKKLLSYIFQITNKCAVKFRYTYVSRIQNYIINILECLYKANDLDINDLKRLEYQKEAKTILRLLDTVSESATEVKCFNMHQYCYITKEISSIMSMLDGWINSDLKRKEALV